MANTGMGSTYPNNSNAVDNRQTFLGLSKTGLGETRVGRMYTPVHEAMCAQNAGQCNGIAGDMMYSGANSSKTITPSNAFGANPQIRASNAISFISENIKGFTASALYSANNTEVTDSNTTSPLGQGSVNYKMAGGQIAYTGIKNLDIRYGAQRTSMNRDNANVTTAAPALIGNQLLQATPATTVTARSAQRDQYAGISYDFGVAKVGFQNSVLDVEAIDALTLHRSASQVSVSAPLTAVIGTWASYGKGTMRTATSATNANFSGYQAGATYALSKRTSLYAIYGYATQDAVVGASIKYSDTQYALGAKHTF
jgi:predicted porin